MAQSKFMDSLLWVNYQYRISENLHFSDSSQSPLEQEDIISFESLDWYPIDTNYIVWAKVELSPDAEPFEMPTTTERKPVYRQFAWLQFELMDSTIRIPVYENLALRKRPGFADHLFFPFTDLSNAFGSYGGGRYLDLTVPEGDSILIDFNRAYNPYCAYNGRYSCPIPPAANHIPLTIKSGVRYTLKH